MFVYRHLFTRSSACVAHTKTITYLVCYCFCLGHAGNTHGKQKMLNKHGSSSLVFTHPGDKKCNLYYYYYYSQNRQFLPIWGVKSATTSSTATVDSFYHPEGKKCNYYLKEQTPWHNSADKISTCAREGYLKNRDISDGTTFFDT